MCEVKQKGGKFSPIK